MQFPDKMHLLPRGPLRAMNLSTAGGSFSAKKDGGEACHGHECRDRAPRCNAAASFALAPSPAIHYSHTNTPPYHIFLFYHIYDTDYDYETMTMSYSITMLQYDYESDYGLRIMDHGGLWHH